MQTQNRVYVHFITEGRTVLVGKLKTLSACQLFFLTPFTTFSMPQKRVMGNLTTCYSSSLAIVQKQKSSVRIPVGWTLVDQSRRSWLSRLTDLFLKNWGVLNRMSVVYRMYNTASSDAMLQVAPATMHWNANFISNLQDTFTAVPPPSLLIGKCIVGKRCGAAAEGQVNKTSSQNVPGTCDWWRRSFRKLYS